MDTSRPNCSLVFTQLSSIAPSVSKLLQTYTAKLHADIISGDALNTYGNSISLKVSAQVLLERCKLCGETQFTAPVSSCTGHRVENVWFVLAEAEAGDFDRALIKLEPQVAAWLQERCK